MKFMECTRAIDGGMEYFVGQSEEAILAGTEGGKKYARLSYSGHRFLDREEVPARKLARRFPDAITEVVNGQAFSWLGIAMK